MLDDKSWRELRAHPVADGREPAIILASDRDARAVAVARRNAERAHVDADITFAVAALADVEIPRPPGLVVVNPPYGHRLGQRGQTQRSARSLGETMARRFAGWRAAVLCPDPGFVAALSAGLCRKPAQTVVLRNGGLRVQLALFR